MFGTLTEKFQILKDKLVGAKKLTEENISEAVRSVRLALLDADVNYTVVSAFIKRVKEKAIGDDKMALVSAGDQFIKVVHEELVQLMGSEEAKIQFKSDPTKILLCGLQGSGKTTHAAKLALWMKKKYNRRPLLIACDLQRPAAIAQLKILGEKIEVPVFHLEGEMNPVKVAKAALQEKGYDLLIFDTAGRLHVDEALMDELAEIKKIVAPDEVYFVANSGSGQDAVTTAQQFDQKVGITGSILTMLDGSARAGAAISIREVTGRPLVFEGVGEKPEDLQLFNPHSMADRILGMGDIINLVRKAEEQFDQSENDKFEEKLRKASFTYEDYLKQMSAIKRMGPLKGLLKMMPGVGAALDLDHSEKEFSKIEAMILSMTVEERQGRVILEPSRKRRICKGSGTTIDDVNKLVKGFKQIKQFSKNIPALKKKFNAKNSNPKDFDRFFS